VFDKYSTGLRLDKVSVRRIASYRCFTALSIYRCVYKANVDSVSENSLVKDSILRDSSLRGKSAPRSAAGRIMRKHIGELIG
jgi:hypothetical protein